MDFDTEKFISEVRVRPSIWNNRTEYLDKKQKMQDWQEIVNIYGPNLSAPEKRNLEVYLHKKWRNIRDCFVKAHKAKTLNNTKKTPYSYYDCLLFLRDTLPTYIKGNDGEEESDDNYPARFKKPIKRKSKYKIKDTNKKANYSSTVTKPEDKQNEEADDRLFFLSLVKEFRKIPEDMQIQAKVDILKVIKDAQSVNYPNTSCNCGRSNPLNMQIQYQDTEIKSQMSPDEAHSPPVVVKSRRSSEDTDESVDSQNS